jgi:hypothetical protein
MMERVMSDTTAARVGNRGGTSMEAGYVVERSGEPFGHPLMKVAVNVAGSMYQKKGERMASLTSHITRHLSSYARSMLELASVDPVE